MSKSRLMRIFLVDGEGNGLRTVEISNMTIHTTLFPRQKTKDFLKRDEASKPGVYILLGVEDDKNKIYIGEGDPVAPRIKSHFSNKEFWNEAIVFTSKDSYITKTQIQYIESELICIANKAQDLKLDNGNNPTKPNISEVDEIEVNNFIDSIKLILSSLGINIFNDIKNQNENTKNNVDKIYEISKKGIVAKMKIVDYKYIVIKGSKAVKDCVASASKSLINRRGNLIADNILKLDSDGNYVFTEDYIFNSSSTASDVVLGSSTNGRIEWKNEGKTLKEIEESGL